MSNFLANKGGVFNGQALLAEECCVEEQGFYCFYVEKEMACIKCNFWLDKCEVMKVLFAALTTNFSVKAQREEWFAKIAQIPRDAPFGETVRFPVKKCFIMLCGDNISYLTQVSAAASYSDREAEKERYRPAGKPTDVDRPTYGYDDASTSYYKGLRSWLQSLCDMEDTMTRSKFERKYRLKWCGGPKKNPVCIPTLPDRTCQNGDCYTVQDLIAGGARNFNPNYLMLYGDWAKEYTNLQDPKLATRITNLPGKMQIGKEFHLYGWDENSQPKRWKIKFTSCNKYTFTPAADVITIGFMNNEADQEINDFEED